MYIEYSDKHIEHKVCVLVILAHLVRGVDVHTQHLGSNPYDHEFSFQFILEDHTLL